MTKASLADFQLEHVQDVDLINYTRQRNAETWKNALTVEDYIARDHLLGKCKITSSHNNSMCVFVFRQKSSNVIVSSAELIVRESWRFYKSSDGSVAKKLVKSGCIGAVFTYPEFRGRGIAKIMVEEIKKVSKTQEYVGEDGFTFLYSEVGDYYKACDFESFPVPLISLPLKPKKQDLPLEAHLLGFHEAEGLFQQYAGFLSNKLTNLVQKDGIERISIKPSADIVDWFHLRAKYSSYKLFCHQEVELNVWTDSYAEIVKKLSKIEPKVLGIKLNHPNSDKLRGFIIWTYDYDMKNGHFCNHGTLLKVHLEEESVVLQLIKWMKAFFESSTEIPQLQHFENISIWELEIPTSVRDALVLEFGAHKGLENPSRSGILFNNQNDHQRLLVNDIIWEENTKLPWF